MKKETKQSLIGKIEGFVKNADAKVAEIAKYVVEEYNKNARNVTISDIKDSLEIIGQMINGTQQVALPVENSLKKPETTKNSGKKLSKSGKTEKELLDELDKSFENDDKKEEDNDGESEVSLDTENKVNNTKKLQPNSKNKDKAADKTTEPKNEPKQEDKPANNKKEVVKTAPKVVSFPDSFKSTLGTLNARRDIKSIKELHDLIEDEAQLVICAYWTKRDLKQYDYDPMRVTSKPVVNFEQDLDIQDIVYASENGIVVSAVSLYTEVPFTYTQQGFETDEDGLRYMNGVEYQIYEIEE